MNGDFMISNQEKISKESNSKIIHMFLTVYRLFGDSNSLWNKKNCKLGDEPIWG